MKNILSGIKAKQVLVAISIAVASTGNALAFSETEFKTAFKQLVATPYVSQEQYAANAVSAWLNQDYINSLGQAEIDAARNASEAAATSFNQLLKQEPGNPLLLSYAGAATAKSSLAKIAKGEKTTALEDGTAMVEQALQLAGSNKDMHGSVPVALEVRFVAASTFLAVPTVMNRNQQGQQLLKDVLDDQQFAQASVNFRGAVWMRAASLAAEQHRNEEARKYLNEVLKSNAPQSATAAQLLQSLS